jgi:hypothetical protein
VVHPGCGHRRGRRRVHQQLTKLGGKLGRILAALCLIAAGALAGCSGSASIEAEQPYKPGPNRKFAYGIVGLAQKLWRKLAPGRPPA